MTVHRFERSWRLAGAALVVACGADSTSLLPMEAAFRLPAGLAQLPAKLELSANWRLVEAFPGLSFDDPVSLLEAPNTDYLFVSEREGRLFAFERGANVSQKQLVLDLSFSNQGENDSGLLGVAFHPEFGQAESDNRSYLYVHYAFREAPIVGRTPPVFTATQSRLSRFSVDLDTLIADPASELVLIDQADQSVWHQGGAMFFHPDDGFLYLAVGDEGGGACALDNCQRIDKDLFSGVLRIDVDQRGADVSHPIVRQPESGTTGGYFIPNDNPFVGQPGALEEFYALGLRSPHRMTHDPVDGVVWIGELGQEGREELNVLAPGANFQWNVYEGTLRSTGAEPDAPLGIWTSPVLELERRQALAIIGGYVYRGQRLPALQGKYIFADFSRGSIWALPYAMDGEKPELGELELLMTAEFVDREDGITSFGVDDLGELYLLTLGASSKIQRLEVDATPLNAPLALSEIGVFSDLAALQPAASLVDYSVLAPLWSDGADKQRWVALPDQAKVEFAPSGPWQFPAGTVFVKHFAMPLDERDPAQLTRLETRLLVAGAGGEYYGLSYKWRPDGSDAELVTDALLETLEVIEPDGSVRSQAYFYPGPSDCLSCHNPEAGFVLGARTAQLNGAHTAEGGEPVNQLSSWVTRGLFRQAPDTDALDGYPRLSPLSDQTSSPEERVRSYWDSNCSMCHGVRTSIRANWDARYQTALDQQGVVQAESLNGGPAGAELLIEPGEPARSILYQRSASLISGIRMPPLASHRRDEAYLELLEGWITSLADDTR